MRPLLFSSMGLRRRFVVYYVHMGIEKAQGLQERLRQ